MTLLCNDRSFFLTQTDMAPKQSNMESQLIYAWLIILRIASFNFFGAKYSEAQMSNVQHLHIEMGA